MPIILRLKVQQVQQSVCVFELSWGREQRRDATLDYPTILTECYENWQWAYLGYYKNMPLPSFSEPSVDCAESQIPLRGRSISGSAGALDWHSRLVRAEAELMSEFHRWLGQGELLEIRMEIARASRQAAEQKVLEGTSGIQVFLTCSPLALSKFPWEGWEIGAEFGVSSIDFVRTPSNIHQEVSTAPRQRQGRPRVLLILGDDTGLNFQADRRAVQAIDRLAEVQFVGWQRGQNSLAVKTTILQAIADEKGWDVLLFAGHSNEAQVGGGELGIAPGVSMYVSEIETQLRLARKRGLQFALFNSCKGLNIAESLIDRVGLSQVAIMREPIHNQVAQEFLAEFLQNLARYKDVQACLVAACQILKLNKIHTYPSAYLIPSLFCHPGATPFCLTPPHWKRWLPKLTQAIALVFCLLLSVLPPVQSVLLDERMAVQAIYRDLLGQVPPIGTQQNAVPPVALVQVDEQSVRDIAARLQKPAQPMPANYLAELIDSLSEHNSQLKIVGIDYLLKPEDADPKADAVLAESIRRVVNQHQTWFVFGTLYQPLNADDQKVYEADGVFTVAKRQIAQPNWSLQGYVEFSSPKHMTLPYPDEDCQQSCPFAYLLTLVHESNRGLSFLPKLNVNHAQPDLRTRLIELTDQHPSASSLLKLLRKLRFSHLSTWMYDSLGVVMLEPMIDFSIPPDRVYDRIAAHRLREDPALKLRSANQIVLIGSGAYAEAGHVTDEHRDYYDLPPAMRFWQSRLRRDNSAAVFPWGTTRNEPDYLNYLTGSEVHAYMIYQLLNQRMVVAVPSLWVVLLAAPCGLVTAELLQHGHPKRPFRHPCQYRVGLIMAVLVYGLLGLQLYISAGISLPWMLPSILFLAYAAPTLWGKNMLNFQRVLMSGMLATALGVAGFSAWVDRIAMAAEVSPDLLAQQPPRRSRPPGTSTETDIDQFVQTFERRRRTPGLSRSIGFCPITPGLVETDQVWSDRPLFVWRGSVEQIRLRKLGSQEVLWSQTLDSQSRSIVYNGAALAPGQVYQWELLSQSRGNASFVFQVMEAERRTPIANQLQEIDTRLTARGSTREAIAIQKAQYFADQNLWSDALQWLYSIENPSASTSQAIQQIEAALCDG
ncbi:MAG: CHASE2 domain-containing protein [Leptolyngbyaceae cyanobacterium CRU_2_3]|nr:CHASE2 domain-containing protein [Leptolyngbyaceae cyanobacterium CRU_2_3]